MNVSQNETPLVQWAYFQINPFLSFISDDVTIQASRAPTNCKTLIWSTEFTRVLDGLSRLKSTREYRQFA